VTFLGLGADDALEACGAVSAVAEGLVSALAAAAEGETTLTADDIALGVHQVEHADDEVRPVISRRNRRDFAGLRHKRNLPDYEIVTKLIIRKARFR
jgi:hypothetical protein